MDFVQGLFGAQLWYCLADAQSTIYSSVFKVILAMGMPCPWAERGVGKVDSISLYLVFGKYDSLSLVALALSAVVNDNLFFL